MLDFIAKKTIRVDDCDCSVSNSNAHGGHYGIDVTFYNQSWKRIAGEQEYIVVALTTDKLYFKRANREDGYKLSAPKGCEKTRRTCRVPTQRKLPCRIYGYLEYDNKENLYFLRLIQSN